MTIRFTNILPAIFIVILFTACNNPERQNESSEIEFYSHPSEEMSELPFSEAVRVNNMLYLSGQIGVKPGTTELVEGGIQPETKQTMENIRSTLERRGSSMDRVVKCTVFLADIEEWPSMNEVYRTYFPDNPPARSAMAASGLALGARVEIECMAVVDP